MGLGGPGRGVRSFVLRQGRWTRAQRRAWEMLRGRFLVGAEEMAEGGWAAVFGRAAPLVVEIGCGYGEATAAMAAVEAGCDVVAFEVHAPGVAALMLRLEAEGLTNVRVVRADAVRVLSGVVADGGVAGVRVFFPDPWPKKRHHKRRLVNEEAVALWWRKLEVGGGVHFVTDWAEYAEWVEEVFAAHGGFAVASPPARARTGYEARAARAGRAVYEGYFVKRGGGGGGVMGRGGWLPLGVRRG